MNNFPFQHKFFYIQLFLISWKIYSVSTCSNWIINQLSVRMTILERMEPRQTFEELLDFFQIYDIFLYRTIVTSSVNVQVFTRLTIRKPISFKSICTWENRDLLDRRLRYDGTTWKLLFGRVSSFIDWTNKRSHLEYFGIMKLFKIIANSFVYWLEQMQRSYFILCQRYVLTDSLF